MKFELLIRPATFADLDSLVTWTVNISLFREHGMTHDRLRSQLMSALEDSGTDLRVAERGGLPVGFSIFVTKGAFARSGYLKLLSVDPANQSKGTGRALMESLERDFLKPNGLFLLCTHTNTPARAFYEKNGYRQVGEIPDYLTPGLNEVLYYKPAKASF